VDTLANRLASARVFDLSQPYYPGMPHHPAHPPYLFGLTKLHGDYNLPANGSSSSDAIACGSHCGTHIDALSHFSCGGFWFGGKPVEQSSTTGMQHHSVEQIGPILRPAVLLDICGAQGNIPLDPSFVVGPEHLDAAVREQNVTIAPGSIVLLRTGWGQFWRDARRFINEVRGPGPARAGAEWLSSKGIFAAGADTVAFEHVPDAAMPVHIHLLVESGIHIIECLNLEELAAQRIWTFTLAAAPLKLTGATGAPIVPLAVCDA
jgi:kynurenine formamidase